MQNITYKEGTIPEQQALLDLYNDTGSTYYTKDPDRIYTAVKNSMYLLTAWQGEELVGLVRAVGDGLTIVYIQDLAVSPNYQKRGIGREMMNRLHQKYADVKMKILVAEKGGHLQPFYESMGYFLVEGRANGAYALVEKD